MQTRSLTYFRRLSKRHDVIMLQETHGDEEDLEEVRRGHPRFKASGGFMESGNAGGVVILIHERLASQFQVFDVLEAVKGRILVVQMSGAAGCFQLIDVHIDPSLSHAAIKRQLWNLRTLLLG
eukprot:6177788-Pyramimonas_sp.AAC.1